MTVLCVLAMFALSDSPGVLGLQASVPVLIATVAAALAANVYVVGLNQLADVGIDRINKPFLPLPAGTMTADRARRVVVIAGVSAVVVAVWLGTWMLAAIGAAMAIGTAYSVPPLHLKRSAIGAAAAIAVVRGPIVNLGVFAHFQSLAGAPPTPTAAALLMTLVVTCFGVAVAVAKDVPDEAGDRAFGIGTLTVRRGPRVALTTSVAVLSVGLALVSVAAGLALSPVQALGFASTQGLILTALALMARGSPLSTDASGRFYRGLWRLLYAEYVVVPVVLLVGTGAR